jgi:hypothetical protein
MRKAAVVFVLTIIFSAIFGIFWYQEIQYLLPTPVPENYRVVRPDEVIRFDSVLIPQQYAKPKLLHFFNPDCPCSRFNLAHFRSLSEEYGKLIDFYVVVAAKKKVSSAKKLIGKNVTIVIDEDQKLAVACGVYSTPQAAIVQASNKLYFRGNFNRSRYCIDKNSNFVQMALDSLIAGKQPPRFIELATQSYGCTIPRENSILTAQ